MTQPKKILSTVLKLLVGFGSLIIIYLRLKNDLTPERATLLVNSAFSGTGIFLFICCVIGIALNWGIESYKWKLITAHVEAVDFKTALRSVYSGVCLGNLAPGRATEFIGKIIFFKPGNRPGITVLHFINSMFQFSVTIVVGLVALAFKVQGFGKEYSWIICATGAGGLLVLILFAWCVFNINRLLGFISWKISRQRELGIFEYHFSGRLALKLFGFSALRYCVFFSQFALLIFLFHPAAPGLSVLSGIALFFLITSIIPMISVLEAVIRAAIALVVFKDSGIANTTLALATVTLWLLNMVIPSAIGYYFLLKQKFDFKLSAFRR